MEARRRFGVLMRDHWDLRKFRVELWRVAALYRRLRLFDEGIRLLGPVVHGGRKWVLGPTPAELAQYAALLIGVGAVSEAGRWLRMVDGHEEPNKDLFLAFSFISQWSYVEAIEPLFRYIRHPKPSFYDKLVARTNLVHVLVSCHNHRDAEHQIQTLLKDTEAGGHVLLRGNVLESAVVRATELEELSYAADLLREAERLHERSDPVTRLHLLLRSLVLQLKDDPTDGFLLGQLKQLRAKAGKHRSWELSRLCDWHLATFTRDTRRWARLYFGSPYAMLRGEIRDFLPAQALAEGYWWGNERGEGRTTFDLQTGRIQPNPHAIEGKLKVGQLLHRLVAVLARDFYRPIRTAEVFESLYSGRSYDPLSSPLTVRQGVFRLRQWLNETGLKVSISNEVGAYAFQWGEGTGLWLPSHDEFAYEAQSPQQMKLRQLLSDVRKRLSESRATDFQSHLMMEVGNVSSATARRHLALGVELGWICRHGSGKTTRYQLVESVDGDRLFSGGVD